MKFQGKLVSRGTVRGRILWYNNKIPFRLYRKRVVILDDLNIRVPFAVLKHTAGFIAEQGSITAHCAMLAREFHIPALILYGAKRFLKPGMVVSFDDSGILEANVMTTYRYRPRESFHPVKEGQWLLLRPRQHQMMRNSLVEEGIRNIPRIMWGVNQEGAYRQDARGFWYKNHPTPKAMVDRMINDPRWLEEKFNERAYVFRKVTKHLHTLTKVLKKRISVGVALMWLLKTKTLLNEMRPYVNLTQNTIDEVENRLSQALGPLPPQEIIACFRHLTHNSFGEAVRAGRVHPRPRIHMFLFPPPSVPEVVAIPTRRRKQTQCPSQVIRAWKQAQPVRVQKYIKSIAGLMILLSELSELTTYYYVSIMDCVNILLSPIANFLVAHKEIELKEEIFDMHIDYVVELMEEHNIIVRH